MNRLYVTRATDGEGGEWGKPPRQDTTLGEARAAALRDLVLDHLVEARVVGSHRHVVAVMVSCRRPRSRPPAASRRRCPSPRRLGSHLWNSTSELGNASMVRGARKSTHPENASNSPVARTARYEYRYIDTTYTQQQHLSFRSNRPRGIPAPRAGRPGPRTAPGRTPRHTKAACSPKRAPHRARPRPRPPSTRTRQKPH